ncbi:metal ion efflux membrane fusion protein family (plasmid) [Phenylobacterium zucineum HLK1]|uniref:Metal ion efflux membrane fusion protein family n=1 Tax=Phenylobacterium zucineum (strain HLK1) TaxID=450851 RepID=B4RIK7_PHEZH|nr:efflux RND transporter periplasmic adaptor subunit [Phenylobacterium zucineum]ACG80182.1 metal ion efflux membrane fusion protein family [Phenylobacterium zucineum HLK1]
MPRKSLAAGANRNWLLAGAALVAATGIGFTAAKLTSPKPPTAAEASAEKGEAAGAAHAADTLVMGPERITASGVQVQTVATSGIAGEIVAQATVEAEPSGQAALTARAAGSIARINKRLGDPVRAGETLALVESREAAQIAADRATATARAELARKVAARERRLFEQKVSPRQDYETAQAELVAAEAEARRAATAAGAADVSRDGRYVAVISPISGRITAMNASLGAFVQPETELFRIADPSRIQVEAAVTAMDARRIQPGDQAVIETTSGETRSAVVRSVTPGVNEQTRSATVVLSLAGGGGVLQPGQLVRARIVSRQSATTGIVVPEEAVQTVEGRDAVFVRTAKGFRVQPVTVGQRTGGRVEILQGLRGGEAVATRNAFLLKAELGKSAEEE